MSETGHNSVPWRHYPPSLLGKPVFYLSRRSRNANHHESV